MSTSFCRQADAEAHKASVEIASAEATRALEDEDHQWPNTEHDMQEPKGGDNHGCARQANPPTRGYLGIAHFPTNTNSNSPPQGGGLGLRRQH